MIPAPLFAATLALLSEVETAARPVDAVTSGWFRAHRQFDEADRGALLDALYQLLRHRARLDWWLARAGRPASPRARLLAWLALGEGKTADQITRLFDGAKGTLPALTSAERAALRQWQGGTLAHQDMPEPVAFECPDWAYPALQQRFGTAFGPEMVAMLDAPPLDLRINPMRTTQADMLRQMTGMGLPARPMPLSPDGIRLPERLSLSRLPGLKSGEIEIQDEGSQLVALLVGAKPGDRVVDFCAGAGGKTLAMAAQMQNRGHLVACDVNDARLKRCAERLRRAGLHNVETRVLASETDRWVKRHKGGFDRVLIDAPCSGTGTWRRNPDARWRAPDLGLEALAQLQARIVTSAARLVKPGGRLVYATCSVLRAENEDQVTAFLAAHPAFKLLPLQKALPSLPARLEGDFLSLTPAQHGTDGFFAAVLEKDAEIAAPPPA